MIKGNGKGKEGEKGRALSEFDYANDWNWSVSPDDGKGVVWCLHTTREGSNILVEAYHHICLLHFEIIPFQGRGEGSLLRADAWTCFLENDWRISSKRSNSHKTQVRIYMFFKTTFTTLKPRLVNLKMTYGETDEKGSCLRRVRRRIRSPCLLLKLL